jgi:homoserine kinase
VIRVAELEPGVILLIKILNFTWTGSAAKLEAGFASPEEGESAEDWIPMASNSVLIRVPATVGNFGGAEECAALALGASLNVKVTPRVDGHVGIRYFGENGERVPRDRTNLVVRALEAALHLKEFEFTGGDFEIYSSVPVAVGLGSSAAAVLAGLVAADELYHLGLDETTLFELAGVYESRLENLRAAWWGGFVAGIEEGEALTYRRSFVPENLVLNVVVPESVLADKPRTLPRNRQKAESMHRAREFAEFFARAGSGGINLEAPLPPTSEKDVPGLREALEVRAPDVVSVFVCGSGPAVGIFGQGNTPQAVEAVRASFARNGVRATALQFRPTNAGAAEWNSVRPDVSVPPLRGLGAMLPKQTLPV